MENFKEASFLVFGERLIKYTPLATVLLINARIIADVKICIVPSEP
jgi:hypothetical protein